METLAKLFGSAAKVKILRLFLFNPDKTYSNAEIAELTGTPVDAVRKISKVLYDIALIKPRTAVKRIEVKVGRNKPARTRTAKVKGWKLSGDFMYLQALSQLLISTKPFTTQELQQRIKTTGNIRLIICAGVFIQQWDSRLDLLIVGERIRRNELARVIRTMEAEIGKELTYAVFTTEEFKYRADMCDKLIRDVLDYPHEVVLDRVDLRATVIR